ncbi:MAG: UPF0175 family protein, partial [Candidatus Altarchaeum sp.]|nr:UPF0175 family protein [Candidatus Altarchaeum sp.]
MDLRMVITMELYEEGKIFISKAANIVGVTTMKFEDILAKNGFIRGIESALAKEKDKKLKKYL